MPNHAHITRTAPATGAVAPPWRARATAALAALMLASAPVAARADLMDDLRGLQAEQAAVTEELEAAELEAGDTESRLNALCQQIDEIEKDVAIDRASLAAQMRAAYKGGQVGGWDAVLSSEDLPGMLDAAEYSGRIRERNVASVKAVMESTAQLRALRDEAGALYAEQAAGRDALRGELERLGEQVDGLSEEAEVRLAEARLNLARKAVGLAGTASPEPYIAGGAQERPSDPRLAAYVEEKERVYPGDPYWASCCRVSATAIKASGTDPDWPLGFPSDMYAYAEGATDRWQLVGHWHAGDTTDMLEPGDVLITMGDHIKIYVGNDIVRERFPDSDANMYAGSYGQHQPWLYDESISYDYREYGIFRFVGIG